MRWMIHMHHYGFILSLNLIWSLITCSQKNNNETRNWRISGYIQCAYPYNQYRTCSLQGLHSTTWAILSWTSFCVCSFSFGLDKVSTEIQGLSTTDCNFQGLSRPWILTSKFNHHTMHQVVAYKRSLGASSPGHSDGGAGKGRRAGHCVSGIWIPPPIPLWLPVDWAVQFPPISVKWKWVRMETKNWKTCAKGNDVITNVILANQHFVLTFSMQILKFQRRSCKLPFLFQPRHQSAQESLLAGYYKRLKSMENCKAVRPKSGYGSLWVVVVYPMFLL